MAHSMTRTFRCPLVSILSLAFAAVALGQSHPVAPALSSKLGATYTLYLDFGGFDYRNVVNGVGANGTWGYSGKSPGVVPSFDTDGDGTAFSSAEATAIKETWARLAQTYVGFNINVTTVDPAAGAANDASRQAAYDANAHTMHTIFGGNSSDWYGSAGGVSYLSTTQSANVFSGGHTNWVFAKTDFNYPPYMATAGSHENGHGLRLPHQHDETTGAEYTEGDYDGSNFGANGTYGATMGAAYYTQRGTWRNGDAAKGNVNDVVEIQKNADIGGLLDDGIGHSLATATSLAVAADGTVDLTSSARKGFILPLASTGYAATAYTQDIFRFGSKGGLVTLTANDGTDFLTAGVADPGATMRSRMEIYDFSGNLVGTATESADTLKHTFSGTLGAGQYYARILSYGAYVSAHEPNSQYFNMGGYFLTGSGLAQAVPEPSALVALCLGALAVLRRRRRA